MGRLISDYVLWLFYRVIVIACPDSRELVIVHLRNTGARREYGAPTRI